MHITRLLADPAARASAYGDHAFTLDVVARTLWGEARGEGRDGMRGVANVILNRAAHPGWWGRSVAEVCLKPWQFSCWLETDPNRVKLLAVDGRDRSFATALSISVDALAGILPDYTFGATHYHALASSPEGAPAWVKGRAPCVVIGRHAFYNDID